MTYKSQSQLFDILQYCCAAVIASIAASNSTGNTVVWVWVLYLLFLVFDIAYHVNLIQHYEDR